MPASRRSSRWRSRAVDGRAPRRTGRPSAGAPRPREPARGPCGRCAKGTLTSTSGPIRRARPDPCGRDARSPRILRNSAPRVGRRRLDAARGRSGRRDANAEARRALGVAQGVQGPAIPRAPDPRGNRRGGRRGPRRAHPRAVRRGEGRPGRRLRVLRQRRHEFPRDHRAVPRARPDREGRPVRGREPPPRHGDRGRRHQLGQGGGDEGRQPGADLRRAQGRPLRRPRRPAPRGHRAREHRPRRDGALHGVRHDRRVRRAAVVRGPRGGRAHDDADPRRRRQAPLGARVPRRRRLGDVPDPAGSLALVRRGPDAGAALGRLRSRRAAHPRGVDRRPGDGEVAPRTRGRLGGRSVARTSSARSTAS